MMKMIPEPITTKEKFLAKVAGIDVKTPKPVTKEEIYLNKIAENGGGSGGGSVDAYTKSETDALLEDKVDKEPGKQLSEENFTAEDKEKLESMDLSEYVKNTDYASENTPGIAVVDALYGISITGNTHQLRIQKANTNDINNESNDFRPIVPSNIKNVMELYGISSKTTIPEMQEQIDEKADSNDLKQYLPLIGGTVTGTIKRISGQTAISMSDNHIEFNVPSSYTGNYNRGIKFLYDEIPGAAFGIAGKENDFNYYYFGINSSEYVARIKCDDGTFFNNGKFVVKQTGKVYDIAEMADMIATLEQAVIEMVSALKVQGTELPDNVAFDHLAKTIERISIEDVITHESKTSDNNAEEESE